MQFIWQFVNDMVGKGVGFGVLAELFFYACLSFTSMALPLSVLLASLMTFGNLGEHLELIAMKASGISLMRIMRPLIVLAMVVSGISFIFQNNIVPPAQVKMYTIILSLRQKSPDLDIPEGIFYKEITGYNVYVRHKNAKNGMLHDLMIYDYSKGSENAKVIVADSGKLKVSTDKKNLVLTLYSGKSFENLEMRKSRSMNESIPYRRETFKLRDMLIDFDTNFNMADASVMGNRDIAKNMTELTSYIDSVQSQQDSVSLRQAPYFKKTVYTDVFKPENRYVNRTNSQSPSDSLFVNGFENYYNQLNINEKIRYLQEAKRKAGQVESDYLVLTSQQSDVQRQLRSHEIQVHKRFSLAVACLLFFFIGAPLGAIIRKGGLGLPTVLSVVLFLLYWTIDTFGGKMAKQGVWPVWEGMWLSTAVLAALAVFLTYKAVNEYTLLNADFLLDFFKKIKKWNIKRIYDKTK
ncbi:hypothetical protein AGMMS50262_09640 [Bacteroidia bacterium]|nr:hypothetical protein AGMMS50262_09640 [Bacteroidia bacterium]